MRLDSISKVHDLVLEIRAEKKTKNMRVLATSFLLFVTTTRAARCIDNANTTSNQATTLPAQVIAECSTGDTQCDLGHKWQCSNEGEWVQTCINGDYIECSGAADESNDDSWIWAGVGAVVMAIFF